MMQENARLIHARNDDGSMLCGKDGTTFEEYEVSTGPYWHEVNCPNCNDRRALNPDHFMNVYLREAR